MTHRFTWPTLVVLLLAAAGGCDPTKGTAPPPDGWANQAPTRVLTVVSRADHQLLAIEQGRLQTWTQVPKVGAEVGDYVLLGQGQARHDVEIPELGQRVPEVVDIQHVQVVDLETAQRAVVKAAPADAVTIGAVFAELDQHVDQEIVVYGTVVKATHAVGSVWVHLQDGTGDPTTKTHDLTLKTEHDVTPGQRVAFRGILRKDVDIGFGYTFDALVESAVVE